MRVVIIGLMLALMGPSIAGCSGSTTVSEYAGVPRNLLPKDHLDYQALEPAQRKAHSLVAHNSEKVGEKRSLEDTFAEEDAHLRKVTKICQDCTPIIRATHARDSDKRIALDSANQTAVRN